MSLLLIKHITKSLQYKARKLNSEKQNTYYNATKITTEIC